MVKTRSNLVTDPVGPLPFDPTAFAVDHKTNLTKITNVAWKYVAALIAQWSDKPWYTFLTTKPDFQEEESHTWVPRWPLGKGGSVTPVQIQQAFI